MEKFITYNLKVSYLDKDTKEIVTETDGGIMEFELSQIAEKTKESISAQGHDFLACEFTQVIVFM